MKCLKSNCHKQAEYVFGILYGIKVGYCRDHKTLGVEIVKEKILSNHNIRKLNTGRNDYSIKDFESYDELEKQILKKYDK